MISCPRDTQWHLEIVVVVTAGGLGESTASVWGGAAEHLAAQTAQARRAQDAGAEVEKQVLPALGV